MLIFTLFSDAGTKLDELQALLDKVNALISVPIVFSHAEDADEQLHALNVSFQFLISMRCFCLCLNVAIRKIN